MQRYCFLLDYANIIHQYFVYAKKKPCGEPQGWDEKLYILEDCLSNIIGSKRKIFV